MSRVGGGVFRPLLHQVADNADDMRFNGHHFWWSRCLSLCVVLPPDKQPEKWACCRKCFPGRTAENLGADHD
jgi:hypothetical protein